MLEVRLDDHTVLATACPESKGSVSGLLFDPAKVEDDRPMIPLHAYFSSGEIGDEVHRPRIRMGYNIVAHGDAKAIRPWEDIIDLEAVGARVRRDAQNFGRRSRFRKGIYDAVAKTQLVDVKTDEEAKGYVTDGYDRRALRLWAALCPAVTANFPIFDEIAAGSPDKPALPTLATLLDHLGAGDDRLRA